MYVYIIRFYRVTNNAFSLTSPLPRFASSKLFFTIDLDFFLGASRVIVCPKWSVFPLETEWKLPIWMIWIDLVRPMDLETSISGSQLFTSNRTPLPSAAVSSHLPLCPQPFVLIRSGHSRCRPRSSTFSSRPAGFHHRKQIKISPNHT